MEKLINKIYMHLNIRNSRPTHVVHNAEKQSLQDACDRKIGHSLPVNAICNRRNFAVPDA